METNISFIIRLKQVDFFWSYFYLQIINFRQIVLVALGSVLFLLFALWPYLTSTYSLILTFCMVPIISLSVNLMNFVMIMVLSKQNLEKNLGTAIPAVLSQEDFYWQFKTGDSRIKYSGMSKIGIYKRHVLFYIKPNFSFVVPWRDVPEDHRAGIRDFLTQLKAQYNI